MRGFLKVEVYIINVSLSTYVLESIHLSSPLYFHPRNKINYNSNLEDNMLFNHTSITYHCYQFLYITSIVVVGCFYGKYSVHHDDEKQRIFHFTYMHIFPSP
ncbi:hypothetical protein BDC45DRAFT_496801 [Circinella umbellata]|nr:hypothetical protein BDC45DRAFT_496801 [Circinella umbellata]